MQAASRLRADRPRVSGVARRATLSAAVQERLGAQLQIAYRPLISAAPPQLLVDLIAQLDSALGRHRRGSEAAFRDELIGALPALQAYGLSLNFGGQYTDNLVQETLVKAWANRRRFPPNMKMKAWLFAILRNQFYSEVRKRHREVRDADGAVAAHLVEAAAQEHVSDLGKVYVHMAKMPSAQREALLLVAAQGLTYEAAAKVIGCQVGTVKSRVNRARAFLAEALKAHSTYAAADRKW